MKKFLVLIPLFVIFCGCVAESVELLDTVEDTTNKSRIELKSSGALTYYWSRGKKVYLTEVEDSHFVLIDQSLSNNVEDISHISSLNLCEFTPYNRINNTSSGSETILFAGTVDTDFIEAYSDLIVYHAPFYYTENGAKIGVSELFSVKIQDGSQYENLKKFAIENGLEIVENDYIPHWHILSCTNSSKGNALELANKAYESGVAIATSVNFIDALQTDSDSIEETTIPLWNLYDPYGVNLPAVHEITTGLPSIKVAVLDAGFKIDHPNLNITTSWDATSDSSPAKLYSYSSPSTVMHGTAVAGIIGSQDIYGTGLLGIAPDVTLIPISVDYNESTILGQKRGSVYDLSKAIYHAYETGIDVMNCSWSILSENEDLFDAVEIAISQGRNGKGCIIVQSSGNDSGNADKYPYFSYSDIICVGNSTHEGLKYSSSNYGYSLDLVAPGTDIKVINFSSDTTVTGTSAACPHVAATAALMLSVNPDLTLDDVSFILEKTATKLPAYTFINMLERSAWNTHVGYGLLNTLDAVMMADHYSIQDYDELVSMTCSGNEVELKLTYSENIAVVWDLNSKDVTYLYANDSTVTSTLSHTYPTDTTRNIYIAHPKNYKDYSQNSDECFAALKGFELLSGSDINFISLSSNNRFLESIKINGGEDDMPRSIYASGLTALTSINLLQTNMANVYIYNCPSLKTFSTSQSILSPPTINPVPQESISIGDIVDPNVVIGGGATPNYSWPTVPEPNITLSSLSISNCPALETISLENVAIKAIDFEDFPNLKYVYISSQEGSILTAANNLNVLGQEGQALYTAVSSLPDRPSDSKGDILLRCVNDDSSAYIALPIRPTYYNAINTTVSNNNWNVAFLSGYSLL